MVTVTLSWVRPTTGSGDGSDLILLFTLRFISGESVAVGVLTSMKSSVQFSVERGRTIQHLHLWYSCSASGLT